MTKRETASFVLRLIGIYIVLRFIAYFPSVLMPFYSMKSTSISLFPAFISSVITLAHPALCLLIIFKSDKVAAWLVPEDKPLTAEGNVNKNDIMAIGVAIVGLLVIASVIPKFAQMTTKYSLLKNLQEYRTTEYLIELKAIIVASLVELILGLTLFFGSKKMVQIWNEKQFQSKKE
jgi:hypothetical protein